MVLNILTTKQEQFSSISLWFCGRKNAMLIFWKKSLIKICTDMLAHLLLQLASRIKQLLQQSDQMPDWSDRDTYRENLLLIPGD